MNPRKLGLGDIYFVQSQRQTCFFFLLRLKATVVSFCIVAVLVFMVLLSLSAVCHRHALGGQQLDRLTAFATAPER